jgi:hypothetical protein
VVLAVGQRLTATARQRGRATLKLGGAGARKAAGVDTVPELARRSPSELAKKMAEAGKARKLTRRMPSEAEVGKWVAQAKTLPAALEY